MNEIEMNFVVKDKNGLLAFLKELGQETLSQITMTYLGKSGDESFYIRIEEIEKEGNITNFLTAKGSFKSDAGVNQRKEVTLPINDDKQKYIEFLQLIGMELRDTKIKTRHMFKIEDLEITLDEWNVAELGDRLEIEGVSEDKIRSFSAKLLQFCDPEPKN